MTRLAIIAAGAACGVALITAQVRGQQPVFRAGVDLVQLDVSVLDENRQPVRGLTAANFTILEDGKPQPVVAFSAVNLPDVVAPATPWMRDVTPDVTTNEIDNRRVFVLLLDDALMPPDLWAVEGIERSAENIINRLGPDDLATVIFTRDNRHAQDLTNDHAKLLKAVRTLTRMGDTGGSTSMLYSVYSALALLRVSEYLAAIPDRRKTLVFFSDHGGSAEQQGLMGDAIRAAQRANVNIYPIDPCGLRADFSQWCAPGPEKGLQLLARSTGGRATVNTNDFEPGITQMFRETSSYYLLGYRPTNVKADGTFRRLEVKVDRPELEVWTKQNYYAPKPLDEKAPPLPKVPAIEALANILPNRDLPLRVAVAPFAAPGGEDAVVTIALGLGQPARSERLVEPVDVLVKAFAPEGDARGSVDQAVTLNLPPARRGANVTRYDVLAKIELKPGRYELRLSAHSATLDKRGSVFADVEVPDFRQAPVSLSGVAISTLPGAPVAPANSLAAILPIVPTTEREFTRATRVTAFLRAYQGGKSPLAPVTLAIRILDGQGATAFERTDTLGAERFATARAADVRFDVPVSPLAPGDYLLTFEASLGKTTARRDVRFQVK